MGSSAGIRAAKDYIQKLAAATSNVLITGETGTGKELVAEMIHQQSARAKKPFVCVNCAAIPDTLLESELFGHERGSFTGAHASRDGLLAAAGGGSIFLDEIGEMSQYAQAKILRVLESRQVQRVGASRSIALDIRVIAATNQELESLVSANRFRKDLYFRLNVARIHLPPLKDRPEDIPELCRHYIDEFNQRFDCEVKDVADDVLQHLLRYHWPGNVRELRNLMEVVFIGGPRQTISYRDLPEHFRRQLSDDASLCEAERERMLAALGATQWNCTKAAQRLQWSRMTLYRKMAKHNVVKAAGA